MPNHTTWDGELAYVQNYEVVYGRNVPVVSFNKTMRVMGSGEAVARAKHNALPHSIVFILFDCLRFEGESLLTTMFTERSGLTLNHSPSRLVNLVPMWDSYYADKVLDQLFESKMEGLVLKNAHGLYVPGGRPIRNQYKLKIDKTYDVVVCGYTMAKPGKFEGMIGALEFGAYHSNGDFVEVGKCSGMTDGEREWWTLMLTTEKKSGNGLVIEIRSNDLVGSGDYGTPRHPQYLGIRSDKNPTDCKMEQFKL
jgi:ATP-dependent DNA ligase